MIIAWEEWAQSTVNEAASQNLIIIRLALALVEATRKTSCCSILLAIFYLQWHEVCARHCVFCGTNGGEQYGVTHLQGT